MKIRPPIFSVPFIALAVLALAASSGLDLFQSGMQAYKGLRYEEALQKLDQAAATLDQREEKASAYLASGVIYQILGKEEQAKTQFSQAIITNPDLKLDRDFYSPKTVELFNQAKQEGLIRVENGKEFYKKAKYDEALKEIETGIKLLLITSPEIDQGLIVDAYFTAAKIYQLLNKEREAVQQFQKAILLDPDRELDPNYYSATTIALYRQAKGSGNEVVTQAKELLAQNDYDSAIRVLEENRSLYFARGTRRDAGAMLAAAYYNTKQNEKAAREVAAVLETDPAYTPQQVAADESFRQFFDRQKQVAAQSRPRILIISPKDNRAHELAVKGFKESLDAEYKEVEPDRAGEGAKAFSPQAVFAAGSDALRAARKLKSGIPVLFANVSRSEIAELKDSNVGGVYLEVPLAAQFSNLKAVLPQARRVGVLYAKGTAEEFLREAEAAAKEYTLEISTQPVREMEDVAEAVRRLRDIDVLWMVWDRSTVFSEAGFQEVIRATENRGIPVFALHEVFVKDRGAMLSVSSNFSAMGAQAADLMKKVLTGPPVKNMPVVAPAYSKLAVNLQTAKKLQVEINPNGITSSTLVYR